MFTVNKNFKICYCSAKMSELAAQRLCPYTERYGHNHFERKTTTTGGHTRSYTRRFINQRGSHQTASVQLTPPATIASFLSRKEISLPVHCNHYQIPVNKTDSETLFLRFHLSTYHMLGYVLQINTGGINGI